MRDAILKSGTVSYQNTRLLVRGADIRLDLKRHLAPRTVRMILQSLPIEGNAHRTDDMVYMDAGIDSGRERYRERFGRGEVGFMPGQRCLCFFTRDCAPNRAVTPVGVLRGGLGALESAKTGDLLRVYEAP